MCSNKPCQVPLLASELQERQRMAQPAGRLQALWPRSYGRLPRLSQTFPSQFFLFFFIRLKLALLCIGCREQSNSGQLNGESAID